MYSITIRPEEENERKYYDIPNKTQLLRLWTELVFHHLGEKYRVLDYNEEGSVITVLEKVMESSDLKYLEENIHEGCSGGSCKIVFGGAE